MNNAVPIIPVLVGLARMPQPAQLLASLNNFAFLNPAPVDTGRDFHQHMERLIRSIDQIVPDRHATSLATSASREEAATPAAPATADRRGDADIPDFTVFRDAPYAPELVVIPAGEFMMGSTDAGHPDERPQHRVTIARHFAIGRYPVTFDEYDRFCDAMRREKPGDQGWGRRRRPVINVSWDDAQAYVSWLSKEIDRVYRLPSEAEWEYACRAGTMARYSFGDAITPDNANYADSGLGRTNEVGAYPPNPWGLHDVHGNIWESVEDDWHESYQGGAERRIGLEGFATRSGSWPLRVAGRLLGPRLEVLPVRLPQQVRLWLPHPQCRVPGGSNPFLILQKAIPLHVQWPPMGLQKLRTA